MGVLGKRDQLIFATRSIGLRIITTTKNGRPYLSIEAKLMPGIDRWLPSFEELFYFNHCLAHCIAAREQDKYNTPNAKGADMVCDFLDAISRSIRGTAGRLSEAEIDMRWLVIKDHYEIPT